MNTKKKNWEQNKSNRKYLVVPVKAFSWLCLDVTNFVYFYERVVFLDFTTKENNHYNNSVIIITIMNNPNIVKAVTPHHFPLDHSPSVLLVRVVILSFSNKIKLNLASDISHIHWPLLGILRGLMLKDPCYLSSP